MRKTSRLTLSVILAAGLAPGFGYALENEPPAAKHVRAAKDLLEKANARLGALEKIAASDHLSAELAAQAQALFKDLKKARRQVQWATVSAEASSRSGIEEIVESARQIRESLAALSEKAQGKARGALAKAAKEAAKTRQAGEQCLSDIASGRKPEDPFAETSAPSLPSNVDNLTREAIQSGTR